MRSFLYFAILCPLITIVNASCASYKCPDGLIASGNGSKFFKNGDDGLNTTYNDAGCMLIINKNCSISGQPLPSPFNAQYFGKCIHKGDVSACSHKESVDYQYPSYSIEFFDRVIKETGFYQCKHLRSKFAQWEMERKSCFTKNELVITICCTIGGLIVLGIAGCVGGGVACCLKSRKRKTEPVAPVVASAPRTMDADLCEDPPMI